MFGYRKKLARDLDDWQKKGWVEETGAKAILKDVDARGLGLGLAPILAILAAILLCFAAMTFVAANWQEMSKLSRLALLFAALGAAYASAWGFKERGMEFFAEAAILLGCGIFGASIMLIAQMYHMEGHPPGAVLLWAGGSALASIMLRARSALALAIILFTLWSVWESEISRELHLAYLIPWAGLLILARVFQWRPALHLLAVGFIIWVFTQIIIQEPKRLYEIITGIGLALCAVAYFAEDWIEEHSQFARPLFAYGMVVAFLGAYAWQFIYRQELFEIVLLAAITLAAILLAIYYAVGRGDNAVLWLGYGGFSIELLALYFETLGTLLDTSLFFLIAGLIVSGLAWFAWKLHQAQTTAGEEG